MGSEYFIFYTEANLVCVTILAILLLNNRIYGTQRETQVWFNRAIIAFMLYFVSDIGWAAVLSGQLPRTRLLIILFNLSNYILLSLMAIQWFMYMAASEKMSFRKDRKKQLLCYLPMCVSALVIVIAYITAPLYWISERNELNGLYYPMMIVVPILYLLTAFLLSVINARKAQSRDEKKMDWMIGIFPLGVMVAGLIQMFSLNAPIFCFGCTVMLLFFYIQHMQTMISVDPLTRLNNRGQINRYMDQLHYRENVRVYLMMIDIDRFKEINDTYGHAEGDQALILVAETLKEACEHFKASAFLGRYGGDEFTIILQYSPENDTPEQAVQAIHSALDKKRGKKQLPYPLEVSIGYAALRDANDTMQDCMIRADEKLYIDKRGKNAGR